MTKKFKKLKNQVKGITVITLVITIIVMLILAGVAVNLTLGENGIFSRTNKSRIEYDIAQTKEKLDLIFVDSYVEKRVNPEYNQDEFLDDYVYSKNKEVIMEEDMVTLNGYTFELNRNVPEVGEYIGEAGNLPPRITRIEVIEKGMTNIKVEVIAAREEGVIYRYSYKKLEEGGFNQAGEEESNAYEYTGLESAKIYTIKVELIKEGKVVDSEEKQVMPGELEKGAITFGNPVWTSGTAEVTISTNTEYRIQYQVGKIEESWKEVVSGEKVENIQNGQTVYARLYDGTNGGEYTSFTIKDDINPIIKNIEAVEIKHNSITIQVQALDNESGLASSNTYKYYLDNEFKKEDANNRYTYTNLSQSSEYFIKVEVIDKAENTSEKVLKVATQKANPVEELLKVGDYVNYEDGMKKLRTCIVLYDSNSVESNNQIQILMMGTIENYNIYKESDEATVGAAANNSYNDAIINLNKRADEYKNTTLSTVGRSIGSVPSSPNRQGGFFHRPSSSWDDKYALYDTDTNYETDWEQMNKLNVHNISTRYWLASRYVYATSTYGRFCMRQVSNDTLLPDETGSGYFCLVNSSSISLGKTEGQKSGLRPVFDIKNGINVIGGNGTKESPYELEV